MGFPLLPTSFPTSTQMVQFRKSMAEFDCQNILPIQSYGTSPTSPTSPTSCQGLKRCLAVCGEARARQLLAHTQLTSLQPSSAR